MNNQELIDDYIGFFKHSKQSQSMRKHSLNYFFNKYSYSLNLAWFKRKTIFDITTKELISYFTWLKNLPGINLTTKKTKWTILSSFLNWLMEDPENDFIVIIPSKRINWNGISNKTNRSNKDVYATKQEIKQILTFFKERNIQQWLIFKLFVHTGMRKGELINLRIDEIELENRHIHLFKGKTMEKHYFVPKKNSDQFLLFLRIFLNKRRSLDVKNDYLFLTNRNQPYSERNFNILLKNAREQLGITNRITCHTFRRSLNDFRKEMDCSLEDRELLLGHKTRNVNISGYTKQDIIRHRKLYDTWNPYKNSNL